MNVPKFFLETIDAFTRYNTTTTTVNKKTSTFYSNNYLQKVEIYRRQVDLLIFSECKFHVFNKNFRNNKSSNKSRV